MSAANPTLHHHKKRADLDIPSWLDRGQGDWSNIRFLRKLCRLSQPEMAWMLSKYLGNLIDATTVSTHENNRRNPTLEQLQAYARVFKVPVMFLFAHIMSVEELKITLPLEGDWETLL